MVTGEAVPDLEQEYVPTLARYTPEGALDKTLAGTGITAFAGVHPVDLLVRPNGAFVVAGSAGEPDWRMVVRQLTPGGEVDTAFGDSGTATADFDGEDITVPPCSSPTARSPSWAWRAPRTRSRSRGSARAACPTPASVPPG